jgi:hypothetical protein
MDFVDEDCRLRGRRDGCGENDKNDGRDLHITHRVPPFFDQVR